MDGLITKLEKFKRLGMYAVGLNYGSQDVGCDDIGEDVNDRQVQLLGWPVGTLGSAKVMFVGSMEELLDFNFDCRPKTISNPPKRIEYKDGGYYVWGTESGVESVMKRLGASDETER